MVIRFLSLGRLLQAADIDNGLPAFVFRVRLANVTVKKLNIYFSIQNQKINKKEKSKAQHKKIIKICKWIQSHTHTHTRKKAKVARNRIELHLGCVMRSLQEEAEIVAEIEKKHSNRRTFMLSCCLIEHEEIQNAKQPKANCNRAQRKKKKRNNNNTNKN